MNKKIGILRTFIREHRVKSVRTNKNDKHPKKLRII